ncbi:MAG: hypothetical protein E7521_08075 [Ruminococcaceae bacterium]|nr:hypothetical protein [Oscillospiraceae bacterium]
MNVVLSILLFAVVLFIIILITSLFFRLFGWSATKIYFAIKNAFVKIKNKRLLFATLWSVFSIVGVVLYGVVMVPYWYFLFGFHTPVFSIYIAIMTGWFSNLPETFFIYLIIGLIFLVTWVIALIRINKSYLFERLILVDRIITILMFALYAIFNFNDFCGWSFIIIPAVEIAIMAGIIVATKLKRKI